MQFTTPNQADLDAAVALFYPAKPVDANLQQKLQALVTQNENTGGTPEQSWGLVLHIVASSPGWQLF